MLIGYAGGIRRIARNRQFENDRSPVSTIVKGIKRAIAGEYSREFSAKGVQRQSRLTELGFRQGGPAGYGWSFCALHGLGRRLTDMLDWCHANVAAGRVGGTRAPGAQEGRAASGFSLGSFSLLRPTLKPSGGGRSTNYALT
jgi:hypothetical protein